MTALVMGYIIVLHTRSTALWVFVHFDVTVLKLTDCNAVAQTIVDTNERFVVFYRYDFLVLPDVFVLHTPHVQNPETLLLRKYESNHMATIRDKMSLLLHHIDSIYAELPA